MPTSVPRLVTAAALTVSASLLLFAAGCGGDKGDDYQPVAPNQPEVPEPAGHPEEGPHGGHLYDLGDHEAFAEITFDEATRKLTIYTLEHDDINKPAPMDAAGAKLALEVGDETVELPLTAVPQEGDPEGQSSRFELAGDQLPAEIKGEEDLHGDLHLSRGGEAWPAVHLEPHEHHEHEHHEGETRPE